MAGDVCGVLASALAEPGGVAALAVLDDAAAASQCPNDVPPLHRLDHDQSL